jgi:hypothetical protein
MDTQIFEKIASSLTVNLICTPLLSNVADADSTVAEFNEPDFDNEKWPDKSGLDVYQHPMRPLHEKQAPHDLCGACSLEVMVSPPR